MKNKIIFPSKSSLCFIALILFCFVLSPAFSQEKASLRNITIEDYFNLKRVGNPQISPDGKWVAYTVRETDLKKDKSETGIRMIPVSGGEAIPMTAKGSSASRPRWSPEGKYLSFLASRNEGKTQIWTLNRLGGEAQQLTKIPQGVSSYEWSPDGKKILLSLRDPDPDADKKDKKPKPWVIDRLQFKRDNAGYLDRRRTHLYIIVPGDTNVTQITSGDYDDSSPVWSPDGKLIAFVSNRTENPDGNSNTDIWIVSADNPDKGKTLHQVTTNPGTDRSPAWSPDGKYITYVTVTEPEIIWYATNHLAVIPSKGGRPKILTKELDRNVSSPRFSPDGNSIFFLLEDSAERHLAKIGVTGNNLQRPVSGQRSVRTFVMGPGNLKALLISEPHLPTEIFMFENNTVRQLTHTNDDFIAELKLAEVENVQFKSKDGTEVEGFIFKPYGFNSTFRYPTLLRIHGGPVSQYDFSFNFDAQLFAANGYVVVLVNPRGSSGYGQDFSLGIYRDWGNKDFEDVMAGVDCAIQKGYSDPERLGVGGWSYGGILTNYVITKTDRFKGAITGASEVLYRSNYGHDHYQLQWEKELGLPWKNAELWERISPFNYVENIVTPTLIMGGEKDWNVPILNSEQLYQALKRLGRTTQLVVYPGEHHGIRKPTFQKDRYERYLDWYDKYVKNGKKKARDIESIHKKFIFADTHAHPDRFHRANVERIGSEEIERYRRSLMDLVVCCVSSDAAYQGGYIKSDGTEIKRLPMGKDYPIEPGEAFAFTLERFQKIINTGADNNAVIALKPADVLEAKQRGELSLIAALEGADGLEGKVDNLRELHRKGLRLLQLIHFRANELGYTQTRPYKAGGLTVTGRKIVKECNRLGIIIDLAHAHKQTTVDVVELSEYPVIFSHTCVKALKKGDRHLSDEEILAITSKGGIVGIWPSASLRSMEEMVRHIDYVKNLSGIDHVGIGSDLRGMRYLPEFGEEANFKAIAQALIDHGYTDEEVGKVMGGNFFRLWEEVSGEK